jgi:hypothetical protein
MQNNCHLRRGTPIRRGHLERLLCSKAPSKASSTRVSPDVLPPLLSVAPLRAFSIAARPAMRALSRHTTSVESRSAPRAPRPHPVVPFSCRAPSDAQGCGEPCRPLSVRPPPQGRRHRLGPDGGRTPTRRRPGAPRPPSGGLALPDQHRAVSSSDGAAAGPARALLPGAGLGGAAGPPRGPGGWHRPARASFRAPPGGRVAPPPAAPTPTTSTSTGAAPTRPSSASTVRRARPRCGCSTSTSPPATTPTPHRPSSCSR